MKHLSIFLLALLASTFSAQAASPAFGDFEITQFSVAGNKVKAKSGLSLTNLALYGVTNTGLASFVDGATFGSHIVGSANIQLGSSGNIGWPNRIYVFAPSDGVLRLSHSGQTDFYRLQFGNTTAAYKAITTTNTAGGGFEFTDATSVNLTNITAKTYYFNRTATVGDFAGPGSPEGVLAAGVGSTYRRTDGGTSTTLYVKETGTTTSAGWVAGSGGSSGLTNVFDENFTVIDGTNVHLANGLQATNVSLAGNTTNTALTASRAMVTAADKTQASSATTAAQIGYLSTTTSDIQDQINAKQSTLTDSASLAAALSDETGTGLSVFATSPTFGTTANFPAGSAAVPSIAWSSDADGTGTGFFRSAANTIGVSINGVAWWTFDSSANLTGAGSLATGTGSATVSSGGTGKGFVISGRSQLNATAGDGTFMMANNATTAFLRLQFGGATAGFAALTTTNTLGGGIEFTDATAVNLTNITVKSVYYTRAATVGDFAGAGSPESVLSASVGSTYRRTDGGAGTTFYVKESGTGNTGWIAK